MFENINEYIEKSKDERTVHVSLNESCIEIGGSGSRECRALLAHYLKTTIPKGSKIHLCHVCNNNTCSNVHHMYWGTASENCIDKCSQKNWKSPWKIYEETVGKEKADQTRKEAGKKGGKGNLGVKKRKTKKEIEKYRSIIKSLEKKHGWIQKAAAELNTSHTSIRRFINSYMPELNIKN